MKTVQSLVGLSLLTLATAGVAQRNYQRWRALQEEVFGRLTRPFARDEKS